VKLCGISCPRGEKPVYSSAQRFNTYSINLRSVGFFFPFYSIDVFCTLSRLFSLGCIRAFVCFALVGRFMFMFARGSPDCYLYLIGCVKFRRLFSLRSFHCSQFVHSLYYSGFRRKARVIKYKSLLVAKTWVMVPAVPGVLSTPKPCLLLLAGSALARESRALET